MELYRRAKHEFLQLQHLKFDKEAKTQSASSTIGVGKIGCPHARPIYHPAQKFAPNESVLNLKPEKLKLVEEHIGSTLQDRSVRTFCTGSH